VKKIFGLCLCAVTFFMLHSNSLALDISGTYDDMESTSSQAENLIDYASSYESFMDSDFVVFHDSQYSYYIVWGDLVVDAIIEFLMWGLILLSIFVIIVLVILAIIVIIGTNMV